MKLKTKVTQKDILYLSISVFVVVVAWIGFNLYHTWVTTKISETVQAQVIPIDPTFDMETIEKIKSRQNVEPLTDIVISSSSASPTPAVSPTTAALQNDVSPIATNGAQ